MIFAVATIFTTYIMMLSVSAADNQNVASTSGEMTNDMKLANQSEPEVYAIVVTDLDNEVKEKMLLNYFSDFGEIIGMYMLLNAENGMKNVGYCFIEYTNEKAVNEILRIPKRYICGKYLYIIRWNVAVPKICRLFVGNLYNEMIEERLLDYFSAFGKVVDLSISLNPINEAENSGYCFVEYADEEAVSKILQNDHVHGVTTLYVELL